MLIKLVLENTDLAEVLRSNLPESSALKTLLTQIANSLKEQLENPLLLTQVKNLVNEKLPMIVNSAVMMNSLTNQLNTEAFANEKGKWLSEYISQYVEHQQLVLSEEDPGMMKLPSSSSLPLLVEKQVLFCSAHHSEHVIDKDTSFHKNTNIKAEIIEYDPVIVRQELTQEAISVSALETIVHKIYPDYDLTQTTVLRAYTDDQIYYKLNHNIRKRGQSGSLQDPLPSLDHTSKALSAAVASMPLEINPVANEMELIVYRGTKSMGSEQYIEGEEIIWHAFTSTTINRKVAEKFAGKNGNGYLFEIVGVTPDISASVAKLSKYPNEEEVLLDCGVKFRVESVSLSSCIRPKVIRLRVSKK
jgi:hypothetical protein